jgi:hypothetical protein
MKCAPEVHEGKGKDREGVEGEAGQGQPRPVPVPRGHLILGPLGPMS